MAVFSGINSAADDGIVKYVSAHKVKMQIMGSGNPGISGVTVYCDYTAGVTSDCTLTATLINDAISTTDEYQLPLLSSGSLSGLTMTMPATGLWVWPVAVPADSKVWLVLTATYTGTPDSTDVLLIAARRDTVVGT